jgi:hypothetical protein
VGDKDKSVASLAKRLIKTWRISAEALQEETSEPRGLWQQTPPVRTLPAFELGDATPEALTELAAEMVRRPALVHDVAAKRFLAMANAVAHKDPESARMSLRGLRSDEELLYFLTCWVRKKQPSYGFDTFDKNDKGRIYEPPAARGDGKVAQKYRKMYGTRLKKCAHGNRMVGFRYGGRRGNSGGFWKACV